MNTYSSALAWYAGGSLMWFIGGIILVVSAIHLLSERRRWLERLAQHFRFREAAIEVLNRSYARGEFTRKQYEAVRRVLDGG